MTDDELHKFGGPAFPESCGAEGYRANVYPGMTLRDYFAAKALQATLSSETAVAEIMASDMGADREGLAKNVAVVAYLFADAMLAVRQK